MMLLVVACLYVSYIYNHDEITQLDKELNEEADRIIKQFDGYSLHNFFSLLFCFLQRLHPRPPLL